MKAFFQDFNGQDLAIKAGIFHIRRAKSVGNVSCHGIYGFIFPSKAICCASVEQLLIGMFQDLQDVIAVYLQVRAQLGQKRPWGTTVNFKRNRTVLALPLLPSPIQNGNLLMTKPTQHPPQTRSKSADRIIVGYNLDLVIDSPT